MALLVGVIALVGYREWTEEIGRDREWIIQKRQSAVYLAAIDAAAAGGGYVVPFSHDIMVVLLNGVPRKSIEEIYRAVSRESPVPVAMRVTTTRHPDWGQVPLEPGITMDEYDESGVAALHIDMDMVSKERLQKGFLKPFIKVMDLYIKLIENVLPRGYIPGYLGGDNIVVFAPEEDLNRALELVMAVIGDEKYKIGIGVDDNPRAALARAAHALSVIRNTRNSRVYIDVRGVETAAY